MSPNQQDSSLSADREQILDRPSWLVPIRFRIRCKVNELSSSAFPIRATGIQPRVRFASAYEALDRAIRERAFPGCAFGVIQDSQVLVLDALGSFTYEAGSNRVTPETLFDVASLTKVLATTAAAMLLFQRGLLDLEMLVGDLLPAFVVGRENSTLARRVTLRNLLAHSSGLPGYVPLFHTATSPLDVFRSCLALPIEAEPGTRVEYSDPGFILLGKALENLMGEDLATFVHREVFVPLGMEHTGFCPPENIRKLIPPTEEDELFRQRRIQGEVQDEHAFLMKGVAGHAGLFSSVPDVLRFSLSTMTFESSSLFKKRTVEVFAERQQPPGSSRGLGWDTPSENSSSGRFFSAHSIGHLGVLRVFSLD